MRAGEYRMGHNQMKVSIVILLAGAVLGTSISSYADPEPEPQSVLSYHGHPDRSGNFVVPALTWDRARSLRFDEGFRSHVSRYCQADNKSCCRCLIFPLQGCADDVGKIVL
jgi:hypothetical protein